MASGIGYKFPLDRSGLLRPVGYVVTGTIGKGGFGIVHEANIASIEFPFAIKFRHPSPFNSDADAAPLEYRRRTGVSVRNGLDDGVPASSYRRDASPGASAGRVRGHNGRHLRCRARQHPKGRCQIEDALGRPLAVLAVEHCHGHVFPVPEALGSA